jgi:hypothetical protein
VGIREIRGSTFSSHLAAGVGRAAFSSPEKESPGHPFFELGNSFACPKVVRSINSLAAPGRYSYPRHPRNPRFNFLIEEF